MPLGLGKIELGGLPCPASPGRVEISVELTLPSIAPPGTYDISLYGSEKSSGNDALCLDVKLDL